MPHTVSVILPTYNPEPKWFEAALDSVLGQTFDDLELIIVDDGSEPPAEDSIPDWAMDDDRVRIIRQENEGFTGAFNTGIENAEGQYIASIADDDLWKETKLEKQVAALEEGYDMAYTGGLVVDEDGNVIDDGSPKKELDTVEELFKNRQPYWESFMFKSEVFDEYGLLDEDYVYSDLELRYRLWPNVDHVFVEDKLTCKRHREGNLGEADERQVEEEERVRNTYFDKYDVSEMTRKISWSLMYRIKGKTFFEKGNPRKAREMWIKSLKYRPTNYKSLMLLFASASRPTYYGVKKFYSLLQS